MRCYWSWICSHIGWTLDPGICLVPAGLLFKSTCSLGVVVLGGGHSHCCLGPAMGTCWEYPQGALRTPLPCSDIGPHAPTTAVPLWTMDLEPTYTGGLCFRRCTLWTLVKMPWATGGSLQVLWSLECLFLILSHKSSVLVLVGMSKGQQRW